MDRTVAKLRPELLWNYFGKIAQIPRPSKHEDRIVAWVRGWAAESGFEVVSDAVGNLVVRVPASPGHESAPAVIIQSHLDMVCEKNRDSQHDFQNDPIRLRLTDGWVCADGTTLGADNGIGVAAALAAATSEEVTHGPLELLFTLDEETGLTGAAGLDGSLLEGRVLLNLDSESDGTLYVGCAGGADTLLSLSIARQDAPPSARWLALSVDGLSGGHSGLNIDENRGNALKLLAGVLHSARAAGIGLNLARVSGGSMHNAIPREAEAVLCVEAEQEERLIEIAASENQVFRSQLEGIDDGVQVKLTPVESRRQVFSDDCRDRVLDLLLALPHGVLAMSRDIEGLVETSNNLAVVRERDDELEIVVSSRSSVAASMRGLTASIAAVARLAGARAETHDSYPGWQPNMQSPLLAVARQVYHEIWGRDPEVTAIHAGLECGLLGEKVDGLDMISFGPQIEGAHSPDEKVEVASVERFWRALGQVLGSLTRSGAAA